MKSLHNLRPSSIVRRFSHNGFGCPRLFAVSTLLAGMIVAPAVARADQFVFSFSGGGLSGSGLITVANAAVPGVPGARQITAITGTFSDTIAGFSGAITGLQSTALPSGINPDGTFIPPGDPAAGFGFSWDNLFFPAGNSPAVCPPPAPGDPHPPYPFGGGLFDIHLASTAPSERVTAGSPAKSSLRSRGRKASSSACREGAMRSTASGGISRSRARASAVQSVITHYYKPE